jgi:hypothetical protein
MRISTGSSAQLFYINSLNYQNKWTVEIRCVSNNCTKYLLMPTQQSPLTCFLCARNLLGLDAAECCLAGMERLKHISNIYIRTAKSIGMGEENGPLNLLQYATKPQNNYTCHHEGRLT